MGGNRACNKNTGEEYYNFKRRSSAWKAKYFKQVRVQFNGLLTETGIAHPEEYCFKSLSHRAIQGGHAKCQHLKCMRKHKIPEAVLRIIKMPDLKKRLKLLLYLTAL